MKIAILFASLLFLSSCESCNKEFRHMKSSMVGLDRHIVLYSADGKEIRKWDTRSMVEMDGGSASWIGNDGKEIKIAGTFIIEEK